MPWTPGKIPLCTNKFNFSFKMNSMSAEPAAFQWAFQLIWSAADMVFELSTFLKRPSIQKRADMVFELSTFWQKPSIGASGKAPVIEMRFPSALDKSAISEPSPFRTNPLYSIFILFWGDGPTPFIPSGHLNSASRQKPSIQKGADMVFELSTFSKTPSKTNNLSL